MTSNAEDQANPAAAATVTVQSPKPTKRLFCGVSLFITQKRSAQMNLGAVAFQLSVSIQ